MTLPISNQDRWKAMLRRQMLANVEHWLEVLESTDDPSSIATTDYDNLLRALEGTLQDPDTFELSCRLLHALHPVAIDYADWDRWQIYLKQALDLSISLGSEPEEASLLVEIGEVYYRLGKFQEAEEHYLAGADKLMKLGDVSSHARALAKMSVLLDAQGRLDEGVALCREAVSMATDAGDERVVALANINLAYIFRRSRKWTEALAAGQNAYDYFKQQSNPRPANKAMLNIVASWSELGEWKKVDELSEPLMNSLAAAGDVRTISKLKNNLGFVAFRQQNYITAEAAWQEALRLHSQIQDREEMANLYNNLGMVYTCMEEWSAAQEMLENAIAAYDQLNDVYNWANSLDNMASIYESTGDNEAFERVLREAKDGLEAIQDTPHVQDLLDIINGRLQAISST